MGLVTVYFLIFWGAFYYFLYLYPRRSHIVMIEGFKLALVVELSERSGRVEYFYLQEKIRVNCSDIAIFSTLIECVT